MKTTVNLRFKVSGDNHYTTLRLDNTAAELQENIDALEVGKLVLAAEEAKQPIPPGTLVAYSIDNGVGASRTIGGVVTDTKTNRGYSLFNESTDGPLVWAYWDGHDNRAFPMPRHRVKVVVHGA